MFYMWNYYLFISKNGKKYYKAYTLLHKIKELVNIKELLS